MDKMECHHFEVRVQSVYCPKLSNGSPVADRKCFPDAVSVVFRPPGPWGKRWLSGRTCQENSLVDFEEGKEGCNMLGTIAVILIILWFAGLVTSATAGGLVHLLVVVAVILILVNLFSGRRLGRS